jgi:hypothetical protein
LKLDNLLSGFIAIASDNFELEREFDHIGTKGGHRRAAGAGTGKQEDHIAFAKLDFNAGAISTTPCNRRARTAGGFRRSRVSQIIQAGGAPRAKRLASFCASRMSCAYGESGGNSLYSCFM